MFDKKDQLKKWHILGKNEPTAVDFAFYCQFINLASILVVIQIAEQVICEKMGEKKYKNV